MIDALGEQTTSVGGLLSERCRLAALAGRLRFVPNRNQQQAASCVKEEPFKPPGRNSFVSTLLCETGYPFEGPESFSPHFRSRPTSGRGPKYGILVHRTEGRIPAGKVSLKMSHVLTFSSRENPEPHVVDSRSRERCPTHTGRVELPFTCKCRFRHQR